MSRTLPYFLLISVLVSGCQSSGMDGKNLDKNNTPTVEEIYPGFYQMEYAGLFLEINPLLAGKVTALRFNDKELFVPKDSSFTNYGATFWPSPQTLWDVWPPPYSISQAPYDAEFKNGQLIMNSEIDQKTGLQVTKKFALSKYDSAVNIIYNITNKNENSVKTAPWEITRLYKGGLLFFPGNKLLPATLKSSGWDPPISDYQLSRIEKDDYAKPLTRENGYFWLSLDKKNSILNRVVADGQNGWAAYVKDRVLFLKKFPDVAEGNFPKNHGEIEILFNPGQNYFAWELQGNYQEIAPEGSLEWPVKWYIRKLPPQIQVKRNSRQLIRYVENLVRNLS